MPQPTKPSINELLDSAPWVPLEEHLDHLRQRVDRSISTAHELRERYRDELLAQQPQLAAQIRRPTPAALSTAEQLFKTGTISAVDGTISPVPLLAGSKIQIGVVIVTNRGDIVDLVETAERKQSGLTQPPRPNKNPGQMPGAFAFGSYSGRLFATQVEPTARVSDSQNRHERDHVPQAARSRGPRLGAASPGTSARYPKSSVTGRCSSKFG